MSKETKLILISIVVLLLFSSCMETPRRDIDISKDPVVNFPNDFDDFGSL